MLLDTRLRLLSWEPQGWGGEKEELSSPISGFDKKKAPVLHKGRKYSFYLFFGLSLSFPLLIFSSAFLDLFPLAFSLFFFLFFSFFLLLLGGHLTATLARLS